MHRAISTSVVKRAPALLESSANALPKRQGFMMRSIKSPRRQPATSQSQQHQQNVQSSTMAALSAPAIHSSQCSSSMKLTREQLSAVFMSAAIPMVGFGFMDNVIMIQAGSYIDSTLGVKFGLATLTAAAMGQVVSDVSGVLFGNTIERLCSPWIKPANLSDLQKALPVVARVRLAGAVGGVMLGCLLGASSLLFVLDSEEEKSTMQQMQQLQGVVQDMLATAAKNESVLRDAVCTMHMKHQGTTKLSLDTRSSGNVSVVSLDHGNASLEHCVREGHPVVDNHSVFIPVLSSTDDLLAVLEVKSKAGMTTDEEEAAARIARYVGIFMTRLGGDD
jgi:Transmembrane protein 65